MLEQLAALGPFFTVQEHTADSAPIPPWHSMSELAEDPDVLHDRVTETQAYLAAAGGQSPDAIEARVAASVTHLGLVARLISPALALAVLGAAVPSLALEDLRWQPVLGGAFPLSLPWGPSIGSKGPQDLSIGLFEGPIPVIGEATRPFAVSEHILWGNVASAVNGAATAITNAAPHLAERTAHLAALLLAAPALRDTHTTFAETGRFRRRSCCLIYRAAPDHAGPLCGDCALNQH
ncbi:FhuF-like iron-sulfur protein [Kribbella kalugense]|uniref:FhuF-like iron-sulfur protein n=2 Tax=Kribbella kalugense TaxID=2512221 RepID=A0A4R7ZTQ9_9ACTN|nr:FhuF-like iron-sulfur protein [Kribbella kalugense]